jgi:aminoglycoside phosphotransferase (APT) family kinase protein
MSVLDGACMAKRAVRAAGLEHDPSRAIEPIGRKPRGMVFRLTCRGADPASVIAKGGDRASATLERLIYQSVLRRLPVATPRLYGVFDDGDRIWLVLEDLGPVEPIWDDAVEARELAGWCARAHRATAMLADLPALPDRGPAHFWTRLQHAKHHLEQRMATTAELRDRECLRLARAACDEVDARWDLIVRACEGFPSSLVHGDLAAQNLRVRHTGQDRELVVLDWEKAGWGVPAVDVARLNLEDYRAFCGYQSPFSAWADLSRLAWAGSVFRALVHNFAAKPPKAVERYGVRLMSVLEEAR